MKIVVKQHVQAFISCRKRGKFGANFGERGENKSGGGGGGAQHSILCLLHNLASLRRAMREGENEMRMRFKRWDLDSPVVGSKLRRKLWYSEHAVSIFQIQVISRTLTQEQAGETSGDCCRCGWWGGGSPTRSTPC